MLIYKFISEYSRQAWLYHKLPVFFVKKNLYCCVQAVNPVLPERGEAF